MTTADIPRDAEVRVLCAELHKMREGLASMGLHAHVLDQVSSKLTKLALEVERHKAEDAYTLGHRDGWAAAIVIG